MQYASTVHLLLLIALAQAPLPPNHPAPNGKAAPSADELIQKLDATTGLKDKAKPFEIAASLGRLYFGQGRYADALSYYRQANEAAAPARALYLAQRKAAGTKVADPAALGCILTADSTLEQFREKAKTLSDAKNAAGATACLKVAMPSVMEVEVLTGTSEFLAGDARAAITTWSRSLESFDDNVEARYARGAATLDFAGDDLNTLNAAKGDLERYLKDAPPQFPHVTTAKKLLARANAAIAAGGFSKTPISAESVAAALPPRPAGQPPVLSKETMEAFQNAPRTPEMEANFAKLVDSAEDALAKGRFQDALDAYKQVMPYQPDNARLRAGMAWTMIKLDRQPMADNVWRVASQSPEAIDALAENLKAKGDAEGARAVWTRLKDTVPAYASKLEGKL